MSSFTEPLRYESTDIFKGGHVRPLQLDDNEQQWELFGARRMMRLTTGFSYSCGRTGMTFIVPAGFLTDLGSIPAVGRLFLCPDDPWAQAFVLHDYLYRDKRTSRLNADLILWDALDVPFRVYTLDRRMLRATCPQAYRGLIFQSVRLFGRQAYKRPAI